jgi:Rrf2 family protein
MPSTNSRFRTAVHALAVIASMPNEAVTSDQIAASVVTDASVVRRLLSALRSSGLVVTAEGRQGGYMLASAPAKVTLLDVYRAVGSEELFPRPERRPNPQCAIGRNIHRVLDDPLDEATLALEHRLGKTTLRDVLQRIAAQ